MTLVLRLLMNGGFSFDSANRVFRVLPGFMGKSLVIAVRSSTERNNKTRSCTWAKWIYIWRSLSSCRAHLTLNPPSHTADRIYYCLGMHAGGNRGLCLLRILVNLCIGKHLCGCKYRNIYIAHRVVPPSALFNERTRPHVRIAQIPVGGGSFCGDNTSFNNTVILLIQLVLRLLFRNTSTEGWHILSTRAHTPRELIRECGGLP